MRGVNEDCPYLVQQFVGPNVRACTTHAPSNLLPQGKVIYQGLLLFAGRLATLLRLTGTTRGRIASLMKSILFQGILAWVI